MCMLQSAHTQARGKEKEVRVTEFRVSEIYKHEEEKIKFYEHNTKLLLFYSFFS